MLLNNFSILLIEDDVDTQENIKIILEDDVKEFYQAYNGQEGFDIFKEKNPDIILTDINMPYLTGLELVSMIRALDKDKPIIILSAYDDRENLLNSINLGSNGFIPKPIDIDLLYAKLNDIAKNLHTRVELTENRNEKIKELYKLAHYDNLTNIPNKFMFELELEKSIKTLEKEEVEFALFFIDIDNFKIVNDTYGHDAGDFVLQSVVNAISSIISKDDILARRSGDEFLIMIRDYASLSHLKRLASDVLLASSKVILWNKIELYVSCSIGISLFPENSTEKEELYSLADMAMYNAKNLGKNSYFFADSNSKQIVKKEFQANIISINSEFFWNKKEMQLIYKNREITLTKNELLLLSLLFSSINYKFTYEQIYVQIWGSEDVDKKESLKTLVKSLRKKLPENFIKNVFNIGYKIELQR